MNVPFLDLKAQYKALQTEIDERMKRVFDHCAFVNGPEVTELEEELNKYVGCKGSVACASGTDALLMALMAADIKAGDEVITTPFTFIATVEVIALLGAKPVYVDIEEDTYNIDASLIEAKITEKTKAIMPVSLYGQPADMDAINAIATKNNLVVIEDAAQSFGGTYRGKRSGNLSSMGATSFFPAKPLGTYGDGGALFVQDEDLLTTLRQIRDHGSESRYHHTRLGINGRLDTMQCAILLAKLGRYDWEFERRSELAHRYNEAFKELESENFKVPILKEGRTSAWAQYTIRVPNREALQSRLKEVGVPTAIHYPTIAPEQPAYKDQAAATQLPRALKASREVLSLPLYPDMPDTDQEFVIERCQALFTETARQT